MLRWWWLLFHAMPLLPVNRNISNDGKHRICPVLFYVFVSVKNGKYKKALKYDKKSLKFDMCISFLLRV